MTLDELHTICSSKPFRPFMLFLADGREVRVRTPEYLDYKEARRIVRVMNDDDSYEAIDLMLIVSAQVDAPATSH
jgi:hypothetical protein